VTLTQRKASAVGNVQTSFQYAHILVPIDGSGVADEAITQDVSTLATAVSSRVGGALKRASIFHQRRQFAWRHLVDGERVGWQSGRIHEKRRCGKRLCVM